MDQIPPLRAPAVRASWQLVLGALFLFGCPGRTAVERWPLPDHSGTEPVRLAILGASPDEGPDLALQADVVGREPSALLLTGNQSHGQRRAFVQRMAWIERLGRPVLAAAGPLESEDAARFASVHGGHSTEGASWGATDLQTSGVTWRLVALDVGARGDRWHEQLFWLPKIASQNDYDHLVLVLGQAPWTLAALAEEEEETASPDAARELLRAAAEHAGPGRLKAVIGGSTGTQELLLPTGPWGEIWLNAGTSGAPGRALMDEASGPHGTTLRLAPGLQEVLGALPAPPAWWELQLDGGRAQLTLRVETRTDRFDEAWRLHYGPEDGWSRGIR